MGVGSVLIATVVVAVIANTFSAKGAPEEFAILEPTAEETAAISLDASATSVVGIPAAKVEVPDVVGKTSLEAEMLLTYAGLEPVVLVVESWDEGTAPGSVVSADPDPGSLVDEGSVVTLFVVGEDAEEPTEDLEHFVVCIDPGHQGASNLDLEPIGPGSTDMKEKVRGGATGVETRIPEYQTVLEISLRLRDLLEDQGIEVVMVRISNDVDISNAERAGIANQAGSDLFVRVHADSSVDPGPNGVSTLYPAGNSWVSPIEGRSRAAASAVQAAVVATTGARDRGLATRSDITGFNWSKVPVVLVECGFLSNPTEDKLLNSEAYQEKLAQGLVDGILAYLGG